MDDAGECDSRGVDEQGGYPRKTLRYTEIKGMVPRDPSACPLLLTQQYITRDQVTCPLLLTQQYITRDQLTCP